MRLNFWRTLTKLRNCAVTFICPKVQPEITGLIHTYLKALLKDDRTHQFYNNRNISVHQSMNQSVNCNKKNNITTRARHSTESSEVFDADRPSQTRQTHERLDWIEQGLTSPPTQYRLCGRQFYRSKDPTNSIKVLKEKLASHRPEEASVHENLQTRAATMNVIKSHYHSLLKDYQSQDCLA